MSYQFYGQTATILEKQCYTVWVKRLWEHEWTHVPGLEFVKGKTVASPDLGTADFLWRYGEVVLPQVGSSLIYAPGEIAGWYISVLGHSVNGTWGVWIGFVETETFDLLGSRDDVPADGKQHFSATGLEDLLGRRFVLGTYTDDAGAPYIQRVVPFNERFSRGMTASGNCSSGVGPDGVPVFSADGADWTSLGILQYMFEYWMPYNPPFVLVGEWATLSQFKPTLDPDGLSPKRVLDELVDYNRGLGWHCVTDGVGPIYVEVFSTLQEGFYAGGVYIPANRYQTVMDFTGYRDVKPQIVRSGVHQYDYLVVESEELIKVCATWDASVGAIVPAWSEAEEAAYLAADDAERSTDKFSRVFKMFRVDPAFNWTGIAPVVYDDGSISILETGAIWPVGKGFEHWIPFEDSGTDDLENRQYRRMFALVANDTGYYYYLDKLSGTVFNKAGDCGIRPTEHGLGFELLVNPNHILAKDHWVGAWDTALTPMLRYETLVLTAFMETDSRVRVVLPLWGGVLSETGKELLLRVPRAETWFAAAGTVLDVIDGVPDVTTYADFIRDDSSKVFAAAGAALACYGQQQAMMELSLKQAAPVCGVGALVVGAFSGWQYEPVGSVVTEIVVDGGDDSMTIRTNQRNLDYKELGEAW